MSIIFAILIFSILIFVHELGHFLAAKASGVQVNEFSMFMGPAIWKKQKGETLYSIRCIPIGGYCAMEGEDSETDNPRSFQKAAWWKRLGILVAGSAMNLIAGFLLVLICSSFLLMPLPQIDYLRTGASMNCEGGLQAGDVILEMDGHKIETTADFDAVMNINPETTEYDFLVQRNGETLLLDDVPMIPKEFQKDDEGEAGTYYGIFWATRRLTAGEVLTQTWNDCVRFGQMIWMSLGMILSGEAGLQDMTGPVGIVSMMNDVAQASGSFGQALLNLLYIGGFIAINLGVMNLLPIPALDGGRILSLLITASVEGITKKKIDPKYEGYIHAAGMILLLALMAFILFKDIFVIFKG